MGEDTVTKIIETDTAPELRTLYRTVARDALPLGRGGAKDADLADVALLITNQSTDLDHLATYDEVCGYRLDSTLPPTYLFVLGFAGSVTLMTDGSFPFPLMGMVHLRNTIIQRRPVSLDEQVDMAVKVQNLRPHPKGQQMDSVMTATIDGEVVWTNTATFLARGRSDDEVAVEKSALDDIDLASMALTSLWRVPADIGRRYSKPSGDINPIHMSGLAAKAFGFKSAIAHGMWTKARALAGLEGRIPDACEIEVAFKTPLLLPRTVEYATSTDGRSSQFGVRSRDGKPHLVGEVRPLS